MWSLHRAHQHGGEKAQSFLTLCFAVNNFFMICCVHFPQLTGKSLAHVINVAVENSKDKVVCIHSQFLEQLLHDDVQANIIAGTTIFVWGPQRDGEKRFWIACVGVLADDAFVLLLGVDAASVRCCSPVHLHQR